MYDHMVNVFRSFSTVDSKNGFYSFRTLYYLKPKTPENSGTCLYQYPLQKDTDNTCLKHSHFMCKNNKVPFLQDCKLKNDLSVKTFSVNSVKFFLHHLHKRPYHSSKNWQELNMYVFLLGRSICTTWLQSTTDTKFTCGCKVKSRPRKLTLKIIIRNFLPVDELQPSVLGKFSRE